jgi:hypothetical protein
MYQLPNNNPTLNRHRRGRPKSAWGRKIKTLLLKKLLPPALIAGLLAGGLFLLDRLGIV